VTRNLIKLSIIASALATVSSVMALTRLTEDEALKNIAAYRTWQRVNAELQIFPVINSTAFG
jgi:hypothetical protein